MHMATVPCGQAACATWTVSSAMCSRALAFLDMASSFHGFSSLLFRSMLPLLSFFHSPTESSIRGPAHRHKLPGSNLNLIASSQGSGVYPFCLFCHAACEEETGMLWLLKSRHGEALLSCLKSFSCIPGILQSPGQQPVALDFW
jgi:hypothetical protein